MSAIEIHDLVKAYPEFTLGPVNLSVEQGEFFGIFGPPSTGKTSVLKLLLGLIAPDKGEVVLAGKNAKSLSAAERDISMVFQNLALFPHMTGRENIIFPLIERGASESEIARQLEFVSKVLHVSHILHKNPAQMSGGERQRIALGRAFAVSSRAMLLDEPIAALDARLREEMRVELKRLQRENNQTFVYVSHDEEEVMAISDRVAVMIDGKIPQIGTPDDVYNRPNSLAVAKVIGSPPMNLFGGRFTQADQSFECSKFPNKFHFESVISTDGEGTFGIRPEDVWLNNGGTTFSLEVTVSSIEPLGGYTIVNVLLGGQIVKIRAPGQVELSEGDARNITFDKRRVHLFDKNGDRLQE